MLWIWKGWNESYIIRKSVLDINSNLLIPWSLQPDGLDLRYSKLWILFDQVVKVWKGFEYLPQTLIF